MNFYNSRYDVTLIPNISRMICDNCYILADSLMLVTFATKTSKGYERNNTAEKTFACKI